MPMLRPLALTRCATSATSARLRPSSAAAPGDLLHQHGDADPAAAGGVEAVLHGDVVVGDHGDHLDAGLGGGQLGGHLEVHDVAGVVLHDVQHARAAVDGRGRLQHLVGHRRGEHLARAGGVEHAEADEPAVQRLVARAAAGDQPDLARHRRVAPVDDLVLVVDAQLRVGGGDAAQCLGDDVGRIVDELLHGVLPRAFAVLGSSGRVCTPGQRRRQCRSRRARAQEGAGGSVDGSGDVGRFAAGDRAPARRTWWGRPNARCRPPPRPRRTPPAPGRPACARARGGRPARPRRSPGRSPPGRTPGWRGAPGRRRRSRRPSRCPPGAPPTSSRAVARRRRRTRSELAICPTAMPSAAAAAAGASSRRRAAPAGGRSARDRPRGRSDRRRRARRCGARQAPCHASARPGARRISVGRSREPALRWRVWRSASR